MFVMNNSRLRYLPVITFVWLVLTFMVSYSIAVGLEHVYSVWPYISDTGTIPPESCVFGLMLNIASLLMGLVLTIRYIQIKILLKKQEKRQKILKYMNIFCLVIGVLAAFGVCIVANFQETSNMTMHLFGANLCFGVGSAYFIIHTILGFLLNKEKFYVNIIRSVLCICYFISFATTFIFAHKAFSMYDVSFRDALLWGPNNPGYNYRLASTFSEWILALSQGLYILSFYHDFKTLKFKLEFQTTDYETNYHKTNIDA